MELQKHHGATWLAAFVCLALFTGCVRYTPEPLSPAAKANDYESRTLETPQLVEFIVTNTAPGKLVWPPASWDLNLSTLAAFYFHPELNVARAKWEVARAEMITAGARPNPTVSIMPEYSLNPES